ncbi:hypothetical protein VI08_17520 [Luteibacter yeojuensis]|uniref:Peptidase M50 domain-containing protein n=2 Tax=Luteibacter yeojuensis TaxID=345309 RepID=A0A0F3K917_9GAMM|nr:hypothetical protein VI08_17520 [Luteibacter yeojuensis]
MWAYMFALGMLMGVVAAIAHAPLAALAVGISTLFISVAIHEAGHYMAARRGGMTVLFMRLFVFELAPRRRGWACRVKRYAHRVPVGLVMALPNLATPWRPVFIAFALGGVVANTFQLACLAIALALTHDAYARMLLGVACCVTAMLLANVIPFKAGMESDGLLALRWWRHPPDPRAYPGMRALARMVSGTAIADMPPADAQALKGMSAMHAVWYAVKADQQRGEWAAAAAQLDAWKAAIPAAKPLRSALSDLTEQVRGEIAFAAAISQRDAALLPDKRALRAAGWGNPGLAPRCRAVVAWLDGDINAVIVATIEAMALADDCTDRSLKESERLIGEALAATPLEPAAP